MAKIQSIEEAKQRVKLVESKGYDLQDLKRLLL